MCSEEKNTVGGKRATEWKHILAQHKGKLSS